MSGEHRDNPDQDVRSLKEAVAALTDVQLLRIRALITALRSDDLRQGQNRLTGITAKGEEYHCCLGVACLVAFEADNSPLKEKKSLMWDRPSAWQRKGAVVDLAGQLMYDDEEGSVLPPNVRQWYGFDDVNPDVLTTVTDNDGEHTVVRSMASLNDHDGWTFAMIADAIENTYIVPRLPQSPTEG